MQRRAVNGRYVRQARQVLQPFQNNQVLEPVLPRIFQRLWRKQTGEYGQMQRVESSGLYTLADCLLGVLIGLDKGGEKFKAEFVQGVQKSVSSHGYLMSLL